MEIHLMTFLWIAGLCLSCSVYVFENCNHSLINMDISSLLNTLGGLQFKFVTPFLTLQSRSVVSTYLNMLTDMAMSYNTSENQASYTEKIHLTHIVKEWLFFPLNLLYLTIYYTNTVLSSIWFYFDQLGLFCPEEKALRRSDSDLPVSKGSYKKEGDRLLSRMCW